MLSVFGLRFSFVNWKLGKNIVALLPVVLAEAEMENTPGKSGLNWLRMWRIVLSD